MTDARARNLRALGLVVGTIAACGVVLALGESRSALAESHAARQSHATVLAQARRALDLRRVHERIADRPRSAPDLIARFTEQLQRAGIGPQALGQHRVGRAEAVGEGRHQRQSVFVTIEGVRPAELARLLTGWRDAEPLWTVRDIKVTHQQRAREGSDRYDVSLTLENIAVSLDSSADSASRPPQEPAP